MLFKVKEHHPNALKWDIDSSGISFTNFITHLTRCSQTALRGGFISRCFCRKPCISSRSVATGEAVFSIQTHPNQQPSAQWQPVFLCVDIYILYIYKAFVQPYAKKWLTVSLGGFWQPIWFYDSNRLLEGSAKPRSPCAYQLENPCNNHAVLTFGSWSFWRYFQISVHWF